MWLDPNVPDGCIYDTVDCYHTCEGCDYGIKEVIEIYKPCPFCGGQPETWWDRDESTEFGSDVYNEGFNIECCSIHIMTIYKDEAINHWNSRYEDKDV